MAAPVMAQYAVTKQILHRLSLESYLRPLRQKIHTLRAVTAGDYSQFDMDVPAQPDTTVREEAKGDMARANSELYDVLVREFGVGRSNEIGRVVRNMVLKSSFNVPSVEFEDVDEIEAAMMSTYLSKVFSMTEAVEEMRWALMDSLIGGYGFVWVSVLGGEPTIRAISSLEVIWDPAVEKFHKARWFGVGVTLRLLDWVDVFGEAPFADLLEGAEACEMENPLRLIYYYDIDGDDGHYAVVRGDRVQRERWESEKDSPFVEGPGPNPHYIDTDGYPRPIMPIVPINALLLPGTNHATSLVSMMMPHQVQLRIAEQYKVDVALRGKPSWLVLREAVDEALIDEIIDGEMPAVLPVKDLKAIMALEPQQIPECILDMQRDANLQIVAMGGDNPYSAGKPVEGIRFAAETNQIGQEASLVTASVAQAAAKHWARVSQVVLANAIYHESPITLRMDDVTMEFGPGRPIADFLVADAPAVVSEDSLRFLNKSERMNQAKFLYDLALSAQAFAPAAPAKAFEKVLREFGEKDIAGWLERPDVPMMGASGMSADAEVASDVQ